MSKIGWYKLVCRARNVSQKCRLAKWILPTFAEVAALPLAPPRHPKTTPLAASVHFSFKCEPSEYMTQPCGMNLFLNA